MVRTWKFVLKRRSEFRCNKGGRFWGRSFWSVEFLGTTQPFGIREARFGQKKMIDISSSKGIWNIEFEICGSEVVESIWPRSVAPLHDQHDSCGPWWGRTKNLWSYVRAGRLMQTAIIANFKHILCMRVFTCCLGSLFFLNAVFGNVDCAQIRQKYDTCFPSWKQFLVAHVLDQHKQTKCEELSGRQSDKSRLNIDAPPPVLFWVCFNNQMLP